MNDLALLSGATRVIAIVGDPIAQVKSAAGVTRALNELGRNCVVIPAHVSAGEFDTFMRGASAARNFDGLIATVPHKFAARAHCASTSAHADFLGAVNRCLSSCLATAHRRAIDRRRKRRGAVKFSRNVAAPSKNAPAIGRGSQTIAAPWHAACTHRLRGNQQ